MGNDFDDDGFGSDGFAHGEAGDPVGVDGPGETAFDPHAGGDHAIPGVIDGVDPQAAEPAAPARKKISTMRRAMPLVAIGLLVTGMGAFMVTKMMQLNRAAAVRVQGAHFAATAPSAVQLTRNDPNALLEAGGKPRAQASLLGAAPVQVMPGQPAAPVQVMPGQPAAVLAQLPSPAAAPVVPAAGGQIEAQIQALQTRLQSVQSEQTVEDAKIDAVLARKSVVRHRAAPRARRVPERHRVRRWHPYVRLKRPQREAARAPVARTIHREAKAPSSIASPGGVVRALHREVPLSGYVVRAIYPLGESGDGARAWVLTPHGLVSVDVGSRIAGALVTGIDASTMRVQTTRGDIGPVARAGAKR